MMLLKPAIQGMGSGALTDAQEAKLNRLPTRSLPTFASGSNIGTLTGVTNDPAAGTERAQIDGFLMTTTADGIASGVFGGRAWDLNVAVDTEVTAELGFLDPPSHYITHGLGLYEPVSGKVMLFGLRTLDGGVPGWAVERCTSLNGVSTNVNQIVAAPLLGSMLPSCLKWVITATTARPYAGYTDMGVTRFTPINAAITHTTPFTTAPTKWFLGGMPALAAAGTYRSRVISAYVT